MCVFIYIYTWVSYSYTQVILHTNNASVVQAGVSYADALAEAVELGYPEPDPRIDITGMDVAKKLVRHPTLCVETLCVYA